MLAGKDRCALCSKCREYLIVSSNACAMLTQANKQHHLLHVNVIEMIFNMGLKILIHELICLLISKQRRNKFALVKTKSGE